MSWATHINMLASGIHAPTPNADEQSKNTKEIAIADRSAAFCFNLNRLLKLAPIESLRFISEMAERLESPNFDCDKDYYQKVIIPSEQLEPLIADIDRLFWWCSNNIAATATVFREDGWSEEDVEQGVTRADEYATYHYDNQASGYPDFLFCMLKSMQALLKHAKENNMTVVYENLMEC